MQIYFPLNGSLEILHTPKQKDNYQESINEVLQEENTLLSENMAVGSKKLNKIIVK